MVKSLNLDGAHTLQTFVMHYDANGPASGLNLLPPPFSSFHHVLIMATIAHAIGLTASGLASGMAIAYPLVYNDTFLAKPEDLKSLSSPQRLSIWQLGYNRGLACIPSLSIVAATGFILTNYLAHQPGEQSIYRYITSGLHLSIIPFTGFFMMKTVKVR